MRLLKIGVYYSAYLEQFYTRFPTLGSQAYSVQHAALMDDCFGSSNFWTKALDKLGYQTCDTVANAEPMQKTWANEHGLSFDRANWLFEITAAQIKDFRPDVLLVADYSTITAEFLRYIRSLCPSIRVIFVWCGAPFGNDSIFKECDVVLSCVPELVAHFQEGGHRSYHVNHAFDRRVLEKLEPTAPPVSDFVFLGSIVKADRFHLGREKLLAHVVKETNLQIWSEATATPANGAPTDASGLYPWRQQVAAVPLLGSIARRASRLVRGGLKQSASASAIVEQDILSRSEGPLFGLQMFQQLHDSRVALNTHIDISPINASNMRLFEATGVGTCMLTDWKANLAGLFEVDSEVVAYRDASECVEKIEYLLANESERRNIAAAGQRRTLRDHTFDHRAAQLDTIIGETLN